MNTNNFDVFSHAFFNEYEISSCGSYDNDLPSDSSSTSSESEIGAYRNSSIRIKPQGKVKICSLLPQGLFLVQIVCERVFGTWLYMHEMVVLVRF